MMVRFIVALPSFSRNYEVFRLQRIFGGANFAPPAFPHLKLSRAFKIAAKLKSALYPTAALLVIRKTLGCLDWLT
jgi:hypothetical protein